MRIKKKCDSMRGSDHKNVRMIRYGGMRDRAEEILFLVAVGGVALGEGEEEEEEEIKGSGKAVKVEAFLFLFLSVSA